MFILNEYVFLEKLASLTPTFHCTDTKCSAAENTQNIRNDNNNLHKRHTNYLRECTWKPRSSSYRFGMISTQIGTIGILLIVFNS